jgi:hypothetical protein
MASPVKWTVVLRCYACDGKFTSRHLGIDRISVVALVSPCPHCSAQPVIARGPDSEEESKLHRIFNIREETEPVYRKTKTGDTWHFNESCSKWPAGDYVELEATPRVGEICNECRVNQSGDAAL